jgi:hypothetical protein
LGSGQPALPPSTHPGSESNLTMIRRCLFCDTPFSEVDSVEGFASGRRIAYDPHRSRLWAVCDRCHQWTLAPIEDRLGIIESVERMARDEGRLLASTANVALINTPNVSIVRVGRVELAEEAWWRYGRELRKRRRQFERRESRIGAYSFAALASISEAIGLTDTGIKIAWDGNPLVDVLRWRRFPWAAWGGRIRCDHCNSVLLAVRFDLSWWLQPLLEPRGQLAVGVPCDRCDPWTPEKVYRITGDDATHVLRRVLAYQQIDGASDRMLDDAAASIRNAGSATDLVRSFTEGRSSLYRLGPMRRLALEIAVNDSAEQRALGGELRWLERIWRQQNEIAEIADTELTVIEPM